MLLLYAANIYAGYEISIFRARPPALVCGVSAVLPLIGPIIFLSMPTKIARRGDLGDRAPAPPAEAPPPRRSTRCRRLAPSIRPD